MKFACTLCGSRDWPTADTDCPLCHQPDTEERTDNEKNENNEQAP
jgi:hypothetical protein